MGIEPTMLFADEVTTYQLMPYDIVYFGSYTWGDGQLPDDMRDRLRTVLKERTHAIPQAAVFGTGDKMFVKYCRAVDAMAYHLSKFGVPLAGELLKIEQSPRNRPHLVKEWTRRTILQLQHEGVEEHGTATKNQTA
jgi:flavodoxin